MHERYSGPGCPSPLHVSVEELRGRLNRIRAALVERGLAALLVFAPESHYWATGLDTGGFVFFQCGIIAADPALPLTLLTRRPDLSQARDTSLYADLRIWYDANDADPAGELAGILREMGLAGAALGIETATYGLTGQNFAAVQAAMSGVAVLQPASDIIHGMRAAKSASEVSVIREAARLADAAVAAARARLAPGIPDSALTAAAMTAILDGGGDMPPAGPLCNSGPRAIYGRGVGGPRLLQAQDQVVLELAATRFRYNVCIERTFILGEMPAAQRRMAETVRAAMAAMVEAARPGSPAGAIAEAFAQVIDAAGYARSRFSACGYPLGATFRPSWMDVPPMLHPGNPVPLRPGMVFFPHCMLGDAESGLAFGSGDTILITEAGAEVLTRAPFH
jgi:Xaa-Pro dipeptidase